MPLSARTVHDRALVMARQIEEIQIKNISSGGYYSLSLDESTDVSNVAKLTLRVHCSDANRLPSHSAPPSGACQTDGCRVVVL